MPRIFIKNARTRSRVLHASTVAPAVSKNTSTVSIKNEGMQAKISDGNPVSRISSVGSPVNRIDTLSIGVATRHTAPSTTSFSGNVTVRSLAAIPRVATKNFRQSVNQTVGAITAGMPIGLLLALTYATSTGGTTTTSNEEFPIVRILDT